MFKFILLGLFNYVIISVKYESLGSSSDKVKSFKIFNGFFCREFLIQCFLSFLSFSHLLSLPFPTFFILPTISETAGDGEGKGQGEGAKGHGKGP